MGIKVGRYQAGKAQTAGPYRGCQPPPSFFSMGMGRLKLSSGADQESWLIWTTVLALATACNANKLCGKALSHMSQIPP